MTETQKDRNRLWVAALRQNEYRQGQGILKSQDNRYCCLGVACEIYRQHYPKSNMWQVDDCNMQYMFISGKQGSGLKTLPPTRVAKWFGWAGQNPILGEFTAASLNDNFQASFPAIADLIEKEFEL